MINRKLGLKIKTKHLAEEARIIRREELKSYGDTRDWLYLHRVHVVRPEARATNLAYAFAKGVPLHKVERYPENIPQSVWARVTSMVGKYSDKSMNDYTSWISSSMAE